MTPEQFISIGKERGIPKEQLRQRFIELSKEGAFDVEEKPASISMENQSGPPPSLYTPEEISENKIERHLGGVPTLAEAGEEALGAWETFRSVGQGALGEVVGGLGGMGALILGQGVDQAVENIQTARDAFAYHPKGVEGRRNIDLIGAAAEVVEDAVEKGSHAVGADPEIVKPLLLGTFTAVPLFPGMARGIAASSRNLQKGLPVKTVTQQMDEAANAPLVGRSQPLPETPLQPTAATLGPDTGMSARNYWSQDPTAFGAKPPPPTATPSIPGTATAPAIASAPTAVEETVKAPPAVAVGKGKKKPPTEEPPETKLTREEAVAIDGVGQTRREYRTATGVTSSPDLVAQKISPALAGGLRRMEADIIRKAAEFDKPYLDEFTSNMRTMKRKDKAAHNEFKRAWYNQDWRAMRRIYEKQYNPIVADRFVRELKKSMRQRRKELKEVYPTFEPIAGYLPRMVNKPDVSLRNLDAEGFRKYKSLENAHTKGEIDDMTFQMKANDILTRGAWERMPGAKTAHVKKRTKEEISDKELKMYADPEDVLTKYIHETAQSIGERRFLGKNKHLQDSIAELLMKTPGLSRKQYEQGQRMLTARFGPQARQGMSKIWQAAKDVGYMGTIADVMSAVVQLGDIAPAMIRQGPLNTLKAIGQSALPRVLRKKAGVIETEGVGVKDIMHETAMHHGRIGRLLDKLLKYSGFKAVDMFGKRVTLNAARNRLIKQVQKKNTPARLKKDYGWMSKKEFDKLKKAIKEGDIDSPEFHFALINELLDVQPLTLSQMPIQYLRSPNLRIVYTLKTWGVRQINRFREDAVKGNYGNLVGHALAIYLATNMIDLSKMFLESAITGTPITEEDLGLEALNNLLAFVFGSTYAWERATRGEATDWASSLFVPAAFDMILEDTWRAVGGNWKPLISRAPVVGRLGGMVYEGHTNER